MFAVVEEAEWRGADREGARRKVSQQTEPTFLTGAAIVRIRLIFIILVFL